MTAPHTSMLFRGGPHVEEKERTHKREHWVSTMVCMIADAIYELQKEPAPEPHSKKAGASFGGGGVRSPKVTRSKKAIGTSFVIWNKE